MSTRSPTQPTHGSSTAAGWPPRSPAPEVRRYSASPTRRRRLPSATRSRPPPETCPPGTSFTLRRWNSAARRRRRSSPKRRARPWPRRTNWAAGRLPSSRSGPGSVASRSTRRRGSWSTPCADTTPVPLSGWCSRCTVTRPSGRSTPQLNRDDLRRVLVDLASRSPEPAATVVVRAVPDLGDLIKRQLDTQKVSDDEHASQQMHRDGRGPLANVGPIAGHPDGSGDRLAVAELHGEAHRADRLVIRATPGPGD